MTAVKTAVCS